MSELQDVAEAIKEASGDGGNVLKIGWDETPSEDRFAAIKLMPTGAWVGVPYHTIKKGDIFSPQHKGEWVDPIMGTPSERFYCRALQDAYRLLTDQGWGTVVDSSTSLAGVMPDVANEPMPGTVQ